MPNPPTIDLDSLERKILGVESLLVVLAIVSIATADYFVGSQISLGPLYLIPVSYSALTHKLRTTLALVVVCVVLRQLLGPLDNAADPWGVVLNDLAIAAVFTAIVLLLRRLGGQRRRIFELARRQRDELAREVDLGATVQERLLSLNIPPVGRLDIAATSEPLRGVNGDYYDFIGLESGLRGLVVADIAGKGLPAALLMPTLRFATRSLVDDPERLAEQIRRLNREFWETTEVRHYGTLVYACLDPNSGRIRYVNAGHNPPILVDPGGAWRKLDRGGPPIGLLNDAGYETGEVTLEPGGALLLYTDGVTEAHDPSGAELGIEPLIELLVERRGLPAQKIVREVFTRLRAHLDGGDVTDDTTVIAVKLPS